MTALKTTDKKAIELHFGTKKIRNFAEGEIEKGAQLVNTWSFTAGIREPLEAAEVHFVLNFLKNQFKDFSFTEVQEAFDLYSAGKLEFFESHFQSFTNDFISKVLISYKKYRNKALALYHRELEKMQEEKEPTQEEKDQIEQEFLQECLFKPYQKALENGSSLRFENKTGASLFVKYLKNGFYSVSDEQKSRFGIMAKQELQKLLKSKITGQNQKSIKKLIDALELQEEGSSAERQVKECAARLYFEEWINKQIEQKTDLELIKI